MNPGRRVWLNGELVPADRALLPVDDRAILFGDGAYETLRSYERRVFRMEEHVRRLRMTLDGIALPWPFAEGELERAAETLQEVNGITNARFRLTVTGGRHDGEIRLRRTHPPNIVLTAHELTPPPRPAYEDGVTVLISDWRVPIASRLPRLKTINRLPHLMLKEEAIARDAWDSIFCDETDALLEGTATNIFLVLDGVLRTPALTGPLLAGVTRDVVLEIARREGVPVQEGPIPRTEVHAAGEGFLTSTTIELLPITQVDDTRLGDGAPGPVWRRLHRAYREQVQSEIGVRLPEAPWESTTA